MSSFLTSIALTLSGSASSDNNNDIHEPIPENVGELSRNTLTSLKARTHLAPLQVVSTQPQKQSQNHVVNGDEENMGYSADLCKVPNDSTPNSRKTIRSISRALILLQAEHAELQDALNKKEEEEKETINELSSKLAETKAALTQKEEALQDADAKVQELVETNESLLETVANLKQALEQGKQRWESTMEQQKELERELEVAVKKNQPWWQCL